MSERPKEHDWKSCVRHKRTMGSNPILCAKKAPFSGAFSCFLRFYAEFFVFALAKLCTCMRVYSQRYFYVAMPCKALTDIDINSALCTTCYKGMPQIVQLMRRAKPFERSAYDTLFIREHKQAFRALRSLSLEQFPNVREHIQTAKR